MKTYGVAIFSVIQFFRFMGTRIKQTETYEMLYKHTYMYMTTYVHTCLHVIRVIKHFMSLVLTLINFYLFSPYLLISISDFQYQLQKEFHYPGIHVCHGGAFLALQSNIQNWFWLQSSWIMTFSGNIKFIIEYIWSYLTSCGRVVMESLKDAGHTAGNHHLTTHDCRTRGCHWTHGMA